MLEEIEFRIPESYAENYLPDDAGVRSGIVRKLKLHPDDPLFAHIGQTDREFRLRGRAFFTAWIAHREYSSRELANAQVLKVSAKRIFEPAGEECGTQYDESTACPECGAGATQVSELRLDLRKVPRKTDFAETIAGERIISQRFAECLIDADLQGFALQRVLHNTAYQDDPVDLSIVPTGRKILQNAELAGTPHPTWRFWVWVNRPENRVMLERAVKEYVARMRDESRLPGVLSPSWYQLLVNSPDVELSPVTRAGEDPFDKDTYGRCPRGHVVGLNLLSEVTVTRATLSDLDVMETKQMVGIRRGVLRPRPILLLSSKAWSAIQVAKISGLDAEVAHVS